MSLARKKPEVEKAFALVLQRMELSRDLHKRGSARRDVVSCTCIYGCRFLYLYILTIGVISEVVAL